LLDRLIEQYQHRLLRYLVYLAGNRELAEDLFQETWIRVLERGHQSDGKHEFITWLYAVARNLTIDYDGQEFNCELCERSVNYCKFTALCRFYLLMHNHA
jgi:RNA polymerase sigma-70 factor (ECF subfamily)